MGCSLVGSTATAAAFMATKDGGRTGPAPGAERKGRSAAEDGEARLFCLAMQRPVRAGGKEPGAAIAGPGRLHSRPPPEKDRGRGPFRPQVETPPTIPDTAPAT